MTATQRPRPKSFITLGPLNIVWLDLWTNRYGLDLELKLGHSLYSIAFGFGKGIQTLRSPA